MRGSSRIAVILIAGVVSLVSYFAVSATPLRPELTPTGHAFHVMAAGVVVFSWWIFIYFCLDEFMDRAPLFPARMRFVLLLVILATLGYGYLVVRALAGRDRRE